MIVDLLPVSAGADMMIYLELNPRCVASDPNTGARCLRRLSVDDLSPHLWVIEGRGVVRGREASDALFRDKVRASWRRQRCWDHVDIETPDIVAPEWVPFQPDQFPQLVTRYECTWRATGYADEAELEDEIQLGSSGPAEQAWIAETVLYRWYDSDGALVYVGITNDLATRQSSHARLSSWAQFADTCRVERFRSRRDAEIAELAAIESENPIFNARRKKPAAAERRLVEYLVTKGRADLLAPRISRG